MLQARLYVAPPGRDGERVEAVKAAYHRVCGEAEKRAGHWGGNKDKVQKREEIIN